MRYFLSCLLLLVADNKRLYKTTTNSSVAIPLTSSSTQRVRRPKESTEYDTKQVDGEAPVIQELAGMRSTSLLPSLPGPLRFGVVAPERVLSMGKTELNSVQMINWIVWNKTVLTFKMHNYAKLNCLK